MWWGKSTSFLIILISVLLLNCTKEEQGLPEGYLSEFTEWEAGRKAELIGSRGWLSLIGLFWLQYGSNTFGSDSSANIVLHPSFPTTAGNYLVTGQTLVFLPATPDLLVNGENLNEKVEVADDTQAGTTRFAYSHYEWVMIKRDGKFGMRIWDTLLYNTHGVTIDRYDLSGSAIVNTEVIEVNEKVIVDNEVGMKIEMEVPVLLRFMWNGSMYELQAFEGGEDSWFVIFSDETSGNETYGSGRYLYVKKPVEGTTTQIDFNRAYNPPCAYTNFATCLFPPEKNYLDFRMLAGERYN